MTHGAYYCRYAFDNLDPDDFQEADNARWFGWIVDRWRADSKLDITGTLMGILDAARAEHDAGDLTALEVFGRTGPYMATVAFEAEPVTLRWSVAELVRMRTVSRVERAANGMLAEPDRAVEIASAFVAQPDPGPDRAELTVADLDDDLHAAYERTGAAGLVTGWPGLDHLWTVAPGEVTVVTGRPGDGKSTFVDALIVQLAELHGLKAAFWSPENLPYASVHLPRLIQRHVGVPFHPAEDRMSVEQLVDGQAWASELFRWLDPTILTRHTATLAAADRLMRRWPFDVLVLDPFTKFARMARVEMLDFINDFLVEVSTWAKTHQAHAIIVAHPTKPQGVSQKAKADWVPGVFDVAGAAGWANHADNAMTFWRRPSESWCLLRVSKVRHRTVGKPGDGWLEFSSRSYRFRDVDASRVPFEAKPAAAY